MSSRARCNLQPVPKQAPPAYPTAGLDVIDFSQAQPHPGQIVVLTSVVQHDVTVISPGRQFGKSSTRPYFLVNRIASTPGFAIGAYMGPAHSDAKKAYEEDLYNLRQFVVDKGGDDQDRHIDFRPIANNAPLGHPSDVCLCLDCFSYRAAVISLGGRTNEGARVYYASGGTDAHRQFQKHKLHFAFLDEFSHIAYAAWFETIQPMFNTTGGHVLIVGTPIPDGINFTGFEEVFKMGVPGSDLYDSDYHSISGRSEDNPYADLKKIAKSRAFLEKTGRRTLSMCLYDGLFMRDTGSVFGNLLACFVLPATLIGHDYWIYRKAKPGERTVMGLDLGKHNDPSVAAIFSVDSCEQLAVMRLQGDYIPQLSRVDAMYRDFNRPVIYADARGNETTLELLRQKYGDGAIPVKWSMGGRWDKESQVVRGQTMFQTAAWKLLDIPDQREEFRNYAKEETPSHRWTYNAPTGKHDDFVTGSLYALYGLPFVGMVIDAEDAKIQEGSDEWWSWLEDSQIKPQLENPYSLRKFSR